MYICMYIHRMSLSLPQPLFFSSTSLLLSFSLSLSFFLSRSLSLHAYNTTCRFGGCDWRSSPWRFMVQALGFKVQGVVCFEFLQSGTKVYGVLGFKRCCVCLESCEWKSRSSRLIIQGFTHRHTHARTHTHTRSHTHTHTHTYTHSHTHSHTHTHTHSLKDFSQGSDFQSKYLGAYRSTLFSNSVAVTLHTHRRFPACTQYWGEKKGKTWPHDTKKNELFFRLEKLHQVYTPRYFAWKN